MSGIYVSGGPESLIVPMYEQGYGVDPGLVDPDFAQALLRELKAHDKYCEGGAREGREPGVKHDSEIVKRLGSMPLLAEYRNSLNQAITEASGFEHEHLTYLTVRVCPVGAMSSRIHRNDTWAGPWLVTLTAEGSGSINVYDDSVLEDGEEISLTGTDTDPTPLASSTMEAGGAWGAYSGEWTAPHAGGLNTSVDPKVLVLLYGWGARSAYPFSQT